MSYNVPFFVVSLPLTLLHLSVEVGLMRLHCTDEAQQGRNSVASVASHLYIYIVFKTICWSEHCLQLSYVWVEHCTLCRVCEQISVFQWSCTVLPEWWWD